jgi:alpha-glucosidase
MQHVEVSPSGFAVEGVRAKVERSTLCVSFSDGQAQPLGVVCPDQANGLTLQASESYRLTGLGQEFSEPGVIEGAWNGRIRHSGNKMEGFNGGATGNTQFPILYASSPDKTDFALYLDNNYATEWNFTTQPWQIKPSDGQRNLLLMTGDNRQALRQVYMDMVGYPLVPPRKMFGMWLSEYGFDNWQEMDDKLATLKQQRFPIDGVVMDLQWFGNVSGQDPDSQMGSLTWDRDNFPEPEQKIASLKQDGIGMVLIEESYVSEGLEAHRVMEQSGYLARDPESGKAIGMDPNGIGHWWGKGGMIDWTNPAAGKKWHDWKRAPLIDMGIIGHWTDLGEPEMYNGRARYFQDMDHTAIHNLFNYKWLESIYQGYQRSHPEKRPFMMSRSGAPGMQKFGGVMWSADIGSNLTSLAVHAGMQENMMLSGIDYYGSDIGGFHRSGLKAIFKDKQQVLDETYTQWFAYSSLFDVPVRPHTENLCNCKETAPDRVGSLVSNRHNLELRYQLIPYLYSLAHRANREGKPVYPTLGFNYPHDAGAQRSDHKMLGDDLLSVAVAELEQRTAEVYLPHGRWFDYYSNRAFAGQQVTEWSLYQSKEDGNGELYQLPLFAREGAIVPVNPAQQAITSDVPETLALKLFGLAEKGRFTLYEDDGESTAYLDGAVRITELRSRATQHQAQLTIAARGSYAGAPQARPLKVEWVMPQRTVKAVYLDGELVKNWQYRDGALLVESRLLTVSQSHTLKVVLD